jgi:uncharacterized protein (DUF427 family)
MSIPASESRIAIAANPNRVVVRFAGRTVADTRRALTLREGGYPPVLYIPRADVDMRLLERTTHRTRCPFKGEAAYYSITVEGRRAENAVWSYEAPLADVAAIKDHLAFYPNRVDAVEETAPLPD